MKQPQAILFDMDGVLLDSERMFRKLEDNFWIIRGLPLSVEMKARIHALSVPEEYKIMKEELQIVMDYEEYLHEYAKLGDQAHKEAPLASDLDRALSLLCNKHIKMGIVSSSSEPGIELFLQRIANPSLFSFYISTTSSGLLPKPSPEGYVAMATKLSARLEDCIIIEDSNRGIKAGRNVGIFTIATTEFIDDTYIQNGFDLKIAQLKDLITLFD